jgi:phytoene synthase
MNAQSYPGEQHLLALAYEGFTHRHPSPGVSGIYSFSKFHEQLARAYQFCAAYTHHHSRTFYLASALLPPAKRQAMRALYAFCRVSDDLVDHQQAEPEAALNTWRAVSLSNTPEPFDLISLAWLDTRLRYHIPRKYAEQLLDGVGRDLRQVRYHTFEELAAYCYGVASTVGLMAMHIVGFNGLAAISYAVKLGIALQLTNILRDVAEDWRAGRLYLPLEELDHFGISEQDIATSQLSKRWKNFIDFQIERNRRLYAEALPGVQLLHPDGRFAVLAAGELYKAILSEIERHQGDVFHRRAHLNGWAKLRRLPGIWLQCGLQAW